MPLPKRIHQIHLGPEPSPKTKELMDGVRNMNPYFGYWLWQEDDVEMLVGQSMEALRDRFWNYASISNYVRLEIILRLGGIYLDTDFEALKPLDPLVECEAFAATQDDLVFENQPNRICNAIFGATPNNEWVKWQLDNVGRYCIKDAAWGVYLMTVAPRNLVTLVNRDLVYPWSYDTPESDRRPKETSLVAHHWAGSWLK